MKKIYSFIIMALMLCVGFSSCSHEEDDLFGESAAQRLNKSVDKYQNLLTSSENGWVMEFLPSDGSYGGYLYTAKFGDEKVTMASELSLYSDTEEWPAGTEVSSLYTVKAEQGVILTFDTYNVLFHFFSEPRGSSDIDGYESDYEFTFLKTSADEDTIYLRGKKYQNVLKMYKLKNTDSKTFIAQSVEMWDMIEKVNYSSLKIGDKSYPVAIGDKQFTVVDIDNDSTKQATPMFYNPEGFHLYEPVTLDGKEYQYFKYDEETGNIATADGQGVIALPSVSEQFLNSPGYWKFDVNNMCDSLKVRYDSLLTVSDSYTLAGVYIGNAVQSYDLEKGYEKVIAIDWNLSFWGMTFSYPAYYGVKLSYDETTGIFDIEGLGAGYGFEGDLRVNGASPFVNYVLNHAPYKATFNEGHIKTQVKLESVSDPSVWFTLAL